MAEQSTILIVDDELISRSTVEMLLAGEGYKLVFAENGRDALEKANQFIPDLMLLDVLMPDMNGYQVCQQLRANPRLAELPIVMLTALDDRNSRILGLEMGADDFMSKPFDGAELRARVRTITRLNRYRRLVETADQLSYLSNYDVLTGLPNRHLLIERIKSALLHMKILDDSDDKHNLSLFSLDLDGFQVINESFGHEIGDKLLYEVSQRLLRNLASRSTIARISGDKFVIVQELGATPAKEASALAKKLLESLNKPFLLDNHEVFITASIGISIYPVDGDEALDLLKNAETAMFRAKGQGKNNSQFFAAEMNTATFKRLIMENQLRKVLERNELRLYYQPQVELRSGRIIGLEALVRWQHPELGLLTPNHFINLAEESGLIIPMGEWILNTAAEQNKQWQALGLPKMRVAVNLSSRQFQQNNLLQSIKNALEVTQLDPEYLELELTESVLFEEGRDKKSKTVLHELREMGIHIAIDDFGTGYSSLSYLKRFPVDVLKIDRSFIQDICTDNDDAAITSAIIAMAHSLQIQVIAEGVETSEQLALLHLRGCEVVQGYLFSPPLAVEAITDLLVKNSHKNMIRHFLHENAKHP